MAYNVISQLPSRRANNCSGAKTSDAMLKNIGQCRLTISKNKMIALLTISKNELRIK